MDRSEYLQGGVLSVAPGGATNNGVVAGRARLVVKVRDRSGLPLPRARVTATINGAAAPEARADANGRAELDLPAGTGTVRAEYDLLQDAQPSITARAYPAGPWPTFAGDEQAVTLPAGQTFVLTLMPDTEYT